MRERPYINVSGTAVNMNKTGGFFTLNAPQYMSHYKYNHSLSFLPIQANFNSNKYKTKWPIPSNNTYVLVEGFLEEVETNSTGHATTFHVSVDNINFLGHAMITPSTSGKTGITFHSLSISFFITFSQPLQCHHNHPVSNSTLTFPIQPPRPNPPFQNRLHQHLTQKSVY